MKSSGKLAEGFNKLPIKEHNKVNVFTKRKGSFCFSEFLNSDHKPTNCLTDGSQSWLEWFVGFSECDGCFHVSKKCLHFSIAQA